MKNELANLLLIFIGIVAIIAGIYFVSNVHILASVTLGVALVIVGLAVAFYGFSKS